MNTDMSNQKTHYRRVFKSDHLGVADVEDLIEQGSDLIFTISHVKQEFGVRVAGKKGDFNIAYFNEKIKPWVLNAGNCKMLKKFTGSVLIEDWANTKLQLYIDPSVKFQGNDGGVRISPTQPRGMQELTPAMSKAWTNAIAAYKRDGNLNKVLERMIISEQNQELLMGQANAVS